MFLSEPIISTFKVFEKIINSNMPNFWLFMLDITPLQLSVLIRNLPKKSLSIISWSIAKRALYKKVRLETSQVDSCKVWAPQKDKTPSTRWAYVEEPKV